MRRWLFLALLFAVPACGRGRAPVRAAAPRPAPAKPAWAPLSQRELPTTSGRIALDNLDGQIRVVGAEVAKKPGQLPLRARLVALLGTRGQYVGQLADYERAAVLGEDAVKRAPHSAKAYLLRATTRSILHRFGDALADLVRAENLGLHGDRIDGARATILQAEGRYREVLPLRQKLAKSRHDLRSLGALAVLYGQMGDTRKATGLFAEAQKHFRDVSPLPVAWLYFQEARMWERVGHVNRARALYAAAVDRVPGYAHATAHLAMLERPARAIALLRPLAARSDDPEYAAELSLLLSDAGQKDPASALEKKAEQRYAELEKKYPDAFANHAAMFWLGPGKNPAQALDWAKHNLALRQNDEAYSLVLRAALASGSRDDECAFARQAAAFKYAGAPLHLLAAKAFAACGQDGSAAGQRRLAAAGAVVE